LEVVETLRKFDKKAMNPIDVTELPNEVMVQVFDFVGHGRPVAGRVCRWWRELAILDLFWVGQGVPVRRGGGGLKIGYRTVGESVAVAEWALGLGCPWGFVCRGAAAVGNYEIMEWLQAKHRICESIVAAEAVGTAAYCGQMVILKWALGRLGLGQQWRVDCCANAAARGGQLEALSWLYEGCGCWIGFSTCSEAMVHGRLEVLKQLREWGCEWSVMSWQQVVKNGHDEIMKWAVENGYCKNDVELGAAAAQHGNFELLKWLHGIGCAIGIETCSAAAEGGRLEILKWLHGIGCAIGIETCSAAAEGGRLEILKWLREVGCPWNSTVCARAAYARQTELLKWLVKNGCPLSDSVCSVAARDGDLKLLAWAYKWECPWGVETLLEAIDSGHFKVVRWARKRGCQWDERVCARAARVGRLDILQWLRAEGCPWGPEVCSEAAERGHFELLKWARGQGCPWTKYTCAMAAKAGRLDILQWLREHGCPWNKWVCKLAVDGGNLELLRWARAKGCPWDSRIRNHAGRKGYRED
jgi:hypothetical protein